MATTTGFNASFCFSASKRLDCKSKSYVGLMRAKMVSIRYAAPPLRRHINVKKDVQTSVMIVAAAAGGSEIQKKKRNTGGFVEEMRSVAMKLHTRDQAPKEGQKESKYPEDGPIATWKFTVEGYLRFLVDNKLMYNTLERIIHDSTLPIYAEFKNTGLERGEKLSKDLEWFKEQGYVIPEPMAPSITYSQYLKDIAEKDPPAFICHLYNIYFAHSSGGKMVGTKVSDQILDGKKLEFYKWDGQISQLLLNMKSKLEQTAELWTREEKNRCLEETEKAFKFSGKILRLLLS